MCWLVNVSWSCDCLLVQVCVRELLRRQKVLSIFFPDKKCVIDAFHDVDQHHYFICCTTKFVARHHHTRFSDGKINGDDDDNSVHLLTIHGVSFHDLFINNIHVLIASMTCKLLAACTRGSLLLRRCRRVDQTGHSEKVTLLGEDHSKRSTTATTTELHLEEDTH